METLKMKPIDKIITQLDCKYGAPMGRSSFTEGEIKDGTNGKRKYFRRNDSDFWKPVFDCYIPFVDGCYDRGGAYWGSPANLRVRYTKDLSYIEFYRR